MTPEQYQKLWDQGVVCLAAILIDTKTAPFSTLYRPDVSISILRRALSTASMQIGEKPETVQ